MDIQPKHPIGTPEYDAYAIQLRAELAKWVAGEPPYEMPTPALITAPLCRNARGGEEFWFCYHWNGRIQAGKEALNERGECQACDTLSSTVNELPSFMLPEGEL